MPLAVTHVILTIICVDVYRDYFAKHKRNFTLHTVLIAGIAGLLPDIDIPINWILSSLGISFEFMRHGGIMHTPIFGLVFLVPAYYFLRKGNQKMSMYFFVITFGILFHIFLDFLLGGGGHEGIMFFWPLSVMPFKIHLLNNIGLGSVPAAIDAVILLLWLWHEEAKHKIRDFI